MWRCPGSPFVIMSANMFDVSVFKVQFATLDFVTDVMILDVIELCTAVIDRIIRHLDA